jgi:hypothetical protein
MTAPDLSAAEAEIVARFDAAPDLPESYRPSSPVALLDQLDELRAKATAGEWHVAKSGGIDAGDYDTVLGGGPVDCMAYCYGGSSTIEGDNLPADADFIVAAVNALPELIAELRKRDAAVRAVLAVVDALDEVCEPGARNLVNAPTVSRAIRAAIGGDGR